MPIIDGWEVSRSIRQLSDILVELHGQFDDRGLLNAKTQLKIGIN